MFNLEAAISDWRRQMHTARIPRGTVDELESHLREQIAALVAAGKSEADAFAAATLRLGSPALLKTEFRKLGARNYIPSLGWAAWIIFATAFFLPAYAGGFGWQCAGLSATCVTWPEFTFSLSNWSTILLFLMTPANVVMAVSPFLVSKLSRRPLAFKWLRAANVTAFALVWTYFLLLFFHSERQDLRIGCYLWAASFLMFSLSLFRFRARKKSYA
jgi:hypothetical protein